MFGFLIKKNFCDGWDNLLSLVLTNVIFLFALLGAIFLNYYASANVLLQIAALIGGFYILSVIAFAYGEVAVEIADFNGISLLDFFRAIPGVLLDALFFTLLCAVVIFVSAYSVTYYLIESKTLFGYCIGMMILWLDVFFFIAMQWFVPIRSLMHNNFKKCLKKCFIIFFDNTGFTLLMTIYNLVMVVLSVAFIGFMPSVAGLAIANANALRLRMYKYDYLEEHPELKTKQERRQIPWEELIFDDREALGPRKLKSFLFPWKDEEK